MTDTKPTSQEEQLAVLLCCGKDNPTDDKPCLDNNLCEDCKRKLDFITTHYTPKIEQQEAYLFLSAILHQFDGVRIETWALREASAKDLIVREDDPTDGTIYFKFKATKPKENPDAR